MSKEELVQRVEAAIEKIRPYLVADGGNIRLVEITEENIVMVELQGACSGCPMSVQTLKQGVEVAIKKDVPEIVSVESI